MKGRIKITQVVKNVGVVTEPKRPLSIELGSPYLTCFDEVPDIVYEVQRGDTLSEIAERHSTSVRDLMALNNLRSENRIRIGQSLRLLSDSAPEVIEFASLSVGAKDDQSEPFEKPGASATRREEASVEAMLDSEAVSSGGDCMVNC